MDDAKQERIKQLEAELAELKAEPAKANNIGVIALKKIAESVERCRVNLDNIDLERQSETAIKTELQQINYSSYTAMKALEQDITER